MEPESQASLSEFTDYESAIDRMSIQAATKVDTSDNVEDSDLERQIAEMHAHEELQSLDITNMDMITNNLVAQTQTEQISNGSQTPAILSGETVSDASVSVLQVVTVNEHEDLIAVLKGIDTSENSLKELNETSNEITSKSPALEEVIIEGEGQYQVMDVVDDDENSSQQIEVLGQTPMTSDEIRALAMEQIKDISRPKPPGARRRKQDIKPMPVENDLVTSLTAEWSDDDVDVPAAAGTKKNAKKSKDKLKDAGQPEQTGMYT